MSYFQSKEFARFLTHRRVFRGSVCSWLSILWISKFALASYWLLMFKAQITKKSSLVKCNTITIGVFFTLASVQSNWIRSSSVENFKTTQLKYYCRILWKFLFVNVALFICWLLLYESYFDSPKPAPLDLFMSFY